MKGAGLVKVICTWPTLSLAWKQGIDEAILSDEEAGRAYLCGAFLANGSIRDPESGKYQLEISSVYLDHAQGLPHFSSNFTRC